MKKQQKVRLLKLVGISLFLVSYLFLLGYVYIINHNVITSYNSQSDEHDFMYQNLCQKVKI